MINVFAVFFIVIVAILEEVRFVVLMHLPCLSLQAVKPEKTEPESTTNESADTNTEPAANSVPVDTDKKEETKTKVVEAEIVEEKSEKNNLFKKWEKSNGVKNKEEKTPPKWQTQKLLKTGESSTLWNGQSTDKELAGAKTESAENGVPAATGKKDETKTKSATAEIVEETPKKVFRKWEKPSGAKKEENTPPSAAASSISPSTPISKAAAIVNEQEVKNMQCVS
jgi:hypothetical protein